MCIPHTPVEAPHTLHTRYSDSEPTIRCDPNAEKSYLSLEELGNVLTGLTHILQGKVDLS